MRYQFPATGPSLAVCRVPPANSAYHLPEVSTPMMALLVVLIVMILESPPLGRDANLTCATTATSRFPDGMARLRYSVVADGLHRQVRLPVRTGVVTTEPPATVSQRFSPPVAVEPRTAMPCSNPVTKTREGIRSPRAGPLWLHSPRP